MNEEQKWFSKDAGDVLKELDTEKSQGLSEEEAKRRLEHYGKNELPEEDKEPLLKKVAKHFNDVLIYVLLAAAVITGILGHYIDTAVIAVVAIVNAAIGYFQENKAEKALAGIKKMLSLFANVRRDGDRTEVAATDVVVGDIVLLNAGDKVPADVRLLKAENLNVEESPLTGESTTVEKHTYALDSETVLADRKNMAFSGTSIASGSGVGIVTATGEDTEIGKINQSIAEVEDLQTPLIKQTSQFGKMVAIAIVGFSVLMYIFGLLFRDYPLGELLLYVIGIAVAAIPEGLPAILSIILAIGVQNMAGRNAIVRNLPSVETLGSVSIIGSDKTGTLTKNEMTVTSVVTSEREYDVSGTGYVPEGDILYKDEVVRTEEDPTLKDLLLSVKTCNDASLKKDEEGRWDIKGDPTEGCLLTLAAKADIPVASPDVEAKIPFDSSYKYMATLVDATEEKVIYIKGAPDRIFDMVDQEGFKKPKWEQLMKTHAKKGERVIGVAMKKVSKETTSIDHGDLDDGVMFLGLVGIVDPPREEAMAAVKACNQAGIQVKMITGDHVDTASAIGYQLGIGDGRHALEGKEIDTMSDDELVKAANEYDVFARTTPQHKLRLVQAFQQNDKTCAMTGDGVNDAPALKRADVGVAMGIKGTEVAKEASEMVLVDDNFKTIVNAVEEGRRVYDNLKKTILFILPTNAAEAFLITAAIFLGIMMPLTPVQILWVNMVSSVTVSLALAFEQLDKGAMTRPPRPPNTPLLSGYYIFRIIFVALLIGGGTLAMNLSMIDQGYDQAIVNTVTLNTIVITQMFHLFNCRSELEFAFNKDFFSNKAVFVVSGLLILLQLFITYVPFMNTIFETEPLQAGYWLFPIIMGAIVFIVVEIEKVITKQVVNNKRYKRKEGST
ncbi:cation-transporting P-type ATPase [Salicibibacter cibarius]|uniref:Cation-transporting P-type ATPase n=1 Tax=Salicibibacter cibarius TaxID=2743000 RepID=A0A7T7CAV9_9BACI|nr:cation-transporting P-type ATPase [Salicibibacter cibarius]QQK75314.1 cation-transporting P-type ATPase [Salicibibacter cibarius]